MDSENGGVPPILLGEEKRFSLNLQADEFLGTVYAMLIFFKLLVVHPVAADKFVAVVTEILIRMTAFPVLFPITQEAGQAL